MSRRPASENGSQGIPEATVARLPVYLRTLYALADRGIATGIERRTRLSGRGKFRQAPQGPVASGFLRTRGVGYDVDYLVYRYPGNSG